METQTLYEIESMLRDIAARFGPAATPEYMRSEVERVANLVRSWRVAEEGRIGQEAANRARAAKRIKHEELGERR